MRLLAVVIAISIASPALAGTTCRTSATGRTTCFDDSGTITTIRPSLSGRSATINNSNGDTTTATVRRSANGRSATVTTDDGETYMTRRSLNGRSSTITDSEGNTATCRTSYLGTTTCN